MIVSIAHLGWCLFMCFLKFVPMFHRVWNKTYSCSRAVYYLFRRPISIISFQWRHNERDGVSKHRCGVYWNPIMSHDDAIKWKHFLRYWPFVRGIHRSPVNSPHKGQWRGALLFSLICASINGWVNNREAGDLRRHPLWRHCNDMVELKLFKWEFRIVTGP